MAPTPDQMEAGYHNMWDAAQTEVTKRADAAAIARKIIAYKNEYQEIERLTGAPWFMVGPIHNRESSLNFKRHLHNGDPLTGYTYHVPANRPQVGHPPPFSFVESAVDALRMPPHSLDKVSKWSVERILYETEKYNGWGYLKRGNSPYLWSWTNLYDHGKFVADGMYSDSAIDQQAGCVPIIKAIAELDPEVADRLNNRETSPPDEVVKQATAKERATVAGGAAVAAAGGANEVSKSVPSSNVPVPTAPATKTEPVGESVTKTMTEVPDKPAPSPGAIPDYVSYPLIVIGAVAAIVAVWRIISKKNLIAAKWSA